MSLLIRSATSRYYIKPVGGTLGFNGNPTPGYIRLLQLSGQLRFGNVGGGVGFDAHNDRLIETLSSLGLYSVMGWGYLSVDRNAFSTFFYLESGASWTQLCTDSDGVTLKYFDQLGNNATLGTLTLGKWYFMGMSNNGGNWNAYLGDETGSILSSVGGTGAPIGVSPDLYIASSTSSEFLNGRMGEVLAYNAELSFGEFNTQKLYTTPQRTTDLVGQWRMLTAANVLVDSSGNGNPLVAPGAGSWTDESGPIVAAGGELFKNTIKALVGTLSFVGALIATFFGGGTTYNQALSAGLSFAGASLKSTSRSLAGTLASSGALVRSISRALTGVLNFSGALTSVRVFLVALAGALASSGGIVKSTFRALVGSQTFSGAITKRAQRSLIATLSLAGVVVKTTTKTLSGVLSSSSTVVRSISKALVGTLNSTGGVTKGLSRALAATLSFVGALSAAIGGPLLVVLNASLGFVGINSKQASKSLLGSVATTGAMTKRASKALVAVLSSSGSIVRLTVHSVTGALSFAGALAKQTRRSLSGLMSVSSSLAKAVFKTFAGALSVSGQTTRTTVKQLSASVSMIGGFVLSWFAVVRAGVLARIAELREYRAVLNISRVTASISSSSLYKVVEFALSRPYRAEFEKGKMLTVRENNDEELEFRVLQKNGTAQPIVGWSVEFRVTDVNGVTVISKNLVGGGIVVTDANAGLGKVIIPATDTDGKAGDEYEYELKVIDSSTKKVTVSGPSKFVISKTLI